MAERNKAWREAGRLVLELLVVFVGVYAAFALNTWREDRRDEEQQRQITAMIAQHIAGVSQELALVQPQVDSLLYRPFVEAQARGEQPIPVPLQFTSGDIGVGLWEAAVQAGGLDVLDIRTLRDVQLYFARLQYLNNTAERARALSDATSFPTSTTARRRSTTLPPGSFGRSTSGTPSTSPNSPASSRTS